MRMKIPRNINSKYLYRIFGENLSNKLIPFISLLLDIIKYLDSIRNGNSMSGECDTVKFVARQRNQIQSCVINYNSLAPVSGSGTNWRKNNWARNGNIVNEVSTSTRDAWDCQWTQQSFPRRCAYVSLIDRSWFRIVTPIEGRILTRSICRLTRVIINLAVTINPASWINRGVPGTVCACFII